MTRIALALLLLVAAVTAAPPPKAKPVGHPPAWTLTADTTAVGRVNLRAILDLEPVQQVVLTADARRRVKDWSLAKEFRFDPLTDVDGLTFHRHGTKSPEWMTVGHGQFPNDKPKRVVELDWLGESWAAVTVSDTALVIGGSKEAIAPALKSEEKAAKPAVLGLIPKDADKLLGWVAVAWPDELRKADFWKTVGVEMPEKLWDTAPGFVVRLEVDRGDWRFTVRIPTADADAARGWGEVLKELRPLVLYFAQIFAGAVSPSFMPVLNAITNGLGEVLVSGTDVSIALTIPEKSVRPVLEALFPDD